MRQTDLPFAQPEADEHRVLWISDLHLADGELYGRNPMDQLRRAVSHFRHYYSDSRLLIISGDVSETGEKKHYEFLREALAQAGMSALLLVGNHDHRGRLREVFPELTGTGPFIQRYVDIGSWRLIGLDTASSDGSKPPEFCTERTEWLDSCLDDATKGGRRSLVFMHHPPDTTQIAQVLDDTALKAPSLTAVLMRHKPNVELLAFGHIHRAIAGSWYGIPICSNWSTSHQTIYQTRVDALSQFDVQRSPRYAYLRLRRVGVQVHLRSVDWEEAYRTAKAEASGVSCAT